jgi:methylphosphotriester-DNA--protein-cysteine methyltransferase
VLQTLARIEDRLAGAPVEEAGAPSTNGTSFVATKTGSMFHRPECPVVAGRPASELRRVELPAAGMSPCKLCSPLESTV